MKRIGVSIVGGTGYGAGELLRLLALHPKAEVVDVISDSKSGALIEDLHPHLRGFYGGARFNNELSIEKLKNFEKKIVFFALPHGVSLEEILKKFSLITEEKITCIDLSGDLRIKDEKAHSSTYPETPYAEDLRQEFTYGLPELFEEEIKEASHISNPGCFATAVTLAISPIVGLAKGDSFSVSALTGSSGSGRILKATTHHPVRRSNFNAYNVFEHRHEPEIIQSLRRFGWDGESLAFVPISAPISRGIFVSATCTLKGKTDEGSVIERYLSAYEGKSFVRFLKSSPEIENVVGTNFIDISVKVRGDKVSILSAMDNLVKGMAGQAIQNMNIASGLQEEEGLWHPSLRPV